MFNVETILFNYIRRRASLLLLASLIVSVMTVSLTAVSATAVSATAEDTMQINLNDPSGLSRWKISNDTVMGGVSTSQIGLSADQQAIRFNGTVSLENQGGFASAEYQLRQLMTPATQLTLTVKGDGKVYQLRLKTPHLNYGEAYVADFVTTANTVTKHTFSAEDFYVSFRGRKVSPAAELAFEHLDRLGILIAKQQQGSFAIEIQSVQFK